jgi:hypothetical protein
MELMITNCDDGNEMTCGHEPGKVKDRRDDPSATERRTRMETIRFVSGYADSGR